MAPNVPSSTSTCNLISSSWTSEKPIADNWDNSTAKSTARLTNDVIHQRLTDDNAVTTAILCSSTLAKTEKRKLHIPIVEPSKKLCVDISVSSDCVNSAKCLKTCEKSVGCVAKAKNRHQGKITEYFKSHTKALVGIKRDFNYLKKDTFQTKIFEGTKIAVHKKKKIEKKITEKKASDRNIEELSAKKIDNVRAELDNKEPEVPETNGFKIPSLKTPDFLFKKSYETKTVFHQILENHKNRKLVETYSKGRQQSLVTKNFEAPLTKVQNETETPQLEVNCDKTEAGLISGPQSPILSTPKTIRFPAMCQTKTKLFERRDNICCQWSNCQFSFDSPSGLLEHLQASHVLSQVTGEKFVCLWVGCKVYDQKSCSRSWLERHVLSHAGSKPFRCIVDGCGQRFSTQHLLERHVNNHFAADVKKALDSSSGTKLFRRNGKKIRYRRQPWSARMFDYFDSGIMEGLEHRLIESTKARTNGKIIGIPGNSMALVSQITARRITDDGQTHCLVKWFPNDVVPDEWVLEKDYKQEKTVPISSLPSETSEVVQKTLWLTSAPKENRRGRKTKKWIPPPPEKEPEIVLELPTHESPKPEPKPVSSEEPKGAPAPLRPDLKSDLKPIKKSAKKKVIKEATCQALTRLKSPIDPNSLPIVTIPVVDILQKNASSILPTSTFKVQYVSQMVSPTIIATPHTLQPPLPQLAAYSANFQIPTVVKINPTTNFQILQNPNLIIPSQIFPPRIQLQQNSIQLQNFPIQFQSNVQQSIVTTFHQSSTYKSPPTLKVFNCQPLFFNNNKLHTTNVTLTPLLESASPMATTVSPKKKTALSILPKPAEASQSHCLT